MPGSLAPADPATVLPDSLYAGFSRSDEWAIEENAYRNGESQRRSLVTSSRKRWQLTKRLTAAQMTALRTFYLARKGSTEAFWFYDAFEPAAGQDIGSNFDPTGASGQGRHTVHFVGNWEQSIGLGRGETSIALEELA